MCVQFKKRMFKSKICCTFDYYANYLYELARLYEMYTNIYTEIYNNIST